MFLLLIILGIFLLVNRREDRYVQANYSTTDSQQSLDILNERYARGEIDDEEYNQRKKVLKG